MCRIATVLSSVTAAVFTLLVGAPSSFAAILVPMGGGATPTSVPAPHHVGLYQWQIALIVAAAVVAAAGVAVAVARLVHHPRPAVH